MLSEVLYEDVLETMFSFLEKYGGPYDEYLSLPVPGAYGGKPADMFFSFRLPPTGDVDHITVSNIYVVDGKNKKMEARFIYNKVFSVDPSFVSRISEYCDDTKANTYKNVYSQIRRFEFENTVTAKQRDMILQYISTLQAITTKKFFFVYADVFHPFFAWCHAICKLQ